MQTPTRRTMFDLLSAHAAAAPKRPFVMTGSDVTTYAEMAARAGRVAARLADDGVTRGSRVGLICNNRIAWLEIFFGAVALGATVVPFSTWSTASELGYGDHFHATSRSVEDDHLPFRRRGVPAMNLIDFLYGQSIFDNNRNWHTSNDTLRNVCADSLQVVGDVIVVQWVSIGSGLLFFELRPDGLAHELTQRDAQCSRHPGGAPVQIPGKHDRRSVHGGCPSQGDSYGAIIT